MGLLKFIKKMFTKEKIDKVDKNIVENKVIIDTNTLPYSQENSMKNIDKKINNKQNTTNQVQIEKEKSLELKYVDTQTNIQKIDVENISVKELNTIWDIIKIKENTQAEHIIKSIPADKWVTMDEIRHNIKLEFNIEYTNEKSLYPYLKTLTDINLIKLNNTGKKRTWKKNIIFIKENKVITS